MKYLAKKPMCRRIMALMFALVMVAANLLGTGITANAGATNITLSEPEYYDKGTLKSLTATFGWSTDAEVTGRLVLMSKQLSGGEYPDYGDLTNFGNYKNTFTTFDEVLTHEEANETFGIISYSEEKGYNPTSNVFRFNFQDSDIPLNKDARYYVYLWTKYNGHYYPDNLIMVINVANGVVQYTPAVGRNSYDDSLFTTVVNESENRYKVTVRPASDMIRKESSGLEVQENLNSPMTSVVYTTTEGFYFPENYKVDSVNGINVSRDSDTQITVYGQPTMDTEITLTAPTQRSIDLEDRRFSYAYDVQRSPAFPIKGQTITATGLSKPYISTGNNVESSGNWTLTKIGTYSVIKNSDKNSDNLQGIIENISREYQDITSDNIVIHELKEGNRHIAYGVTLAYDSVNGIAVFIGDALSGGAGYLLSAKEETGMISIVANMDVTDWVPPTTYKITVVSTENGTTRTSISETIVGDQVTIYASADANYEVESVIYNDGQDHIVSLIDGKYVFVMPEQDVTVKATYKYVSTDDEVSDGNEEKEPEVILQERTDKETPADTKVTDNTPVDTGDHSQMTAWLYVFIITFAVIVKVCYNKFRRFL